MQHHSHIGRLLSGIVICIASISSCVLPNLAVFSSSIGTIEITIEDDSGIAPLGLYPAQYRYIVSGDGPGGETLYLESDTEAITFEDLSAGTWQFTITEVDPAALPLKQGSITVEVQPANTTTITVPLTLSEGSGSAQFNVVWADGFATNPTVSAVLTPVDGPDIVLSFASNPYQLTAGTTLQSGPYTLTYDIDDDGVDIASGSETIWIFPDVDSFATFDFQYSSMVSTAETVEAPSVTIAWDPPADVTTVIGFNLYTRLCGTVSWTRLARTDLADPEWTFTDEILSYGMYEFGVSSVYDNGTESALHTSLDDNADPTDGWYLDWQSS